MNKPKRHIISRDCSHFKPEFYSTFQKKRLKHWDVIKNLVQEILGVEQEVPVLVARTWKLTKGHYLLVEGPNVYDAHVDDEGNLNLYEPDFIPNWLIEIAGEELKKKEEMANEA